MIAMADNGNPAMVERMTELIQVMVEDGYCAIGLSRSHTTDVEKLLFQLKWQEGDIPPLPDLIALHYNFTLPDIIFLHMPLGEHFDLPLSIRPEVLICPPDMLSTVTGWDADKVLDASNDAGLLFNQITALFE